MKYFIFAILFTLSTTNLYAQDFFIPGNAFLPTEEKLQPLDKNLNDQFSRYDQRRYQIIDGRVIALENEVEKAEPEPKVFHATIEPISETKDNNPQPNVSENVIGSPLIDKKAVEEVKEEAPIVDIKHVSQPPKVASVDSKLPSYKNRYTLYVSDLQEFQKKGKFPENKDLNETLAKLSQPREIVLFEGKVD